MTDDRFGPTIRRFASDEPTRMATAKDLALGISSYWKKAQPDGPIDVVDFFSGCGGMSAGFKAVNALVPTYRIALAVDIDRDSNASYEANIGLRPHAIDVAALSNKPKAVRQLVDGARRSPRAPLVLIGCAPCQGFSSHRNASGASDARNSLFIAFAKIAAIVLPDVVIVENVPEILTTQYWPIVEHARTILRAAGYHSLLTVHDVAEYGVPQQRYRALLVAMRRPFEMPHGFVPRDAFRTVRDAISALPKIEPGRASNDDDMHFSAGHKASTVETIKAVPLDGGSRPWNVGPDCLRRAAARQGRAAYEDVYGRLWWDRPAITITAYARNPASGRFVHPEQHRGLSVREAGLLQGFPDTYRFLGAFDSRFRQIGNAVPPTFSAYLAAHIAKELVRKDTVHSAQPDITVPLGPSFSRLIPALKAGHRKLGDQGTGVAKAA
jgi:DNA (cytosine-5)-methyltransferase 1